MAPPRSSARSRIPRTLFRACPRAHLGRINPRRGGRASVRTAPASFNSLTTPHRSPNRRLISGQARQGASTTHLRPASLRRRNKRRLLQLPSDTDHVPTSSSALRRAERHVAAGAAAGASMEMEGAGSGSGESGAAGTISSGGSSSTSTSGSSSSSTVEPLAARLHQGLRLSPQPQQQPNESQGHRRAASVPMPPARPRAAPSLLHDPLVKAFNPREVREERGSVGGLVCLCMFGCDASHRPPPIGRAQRLRIP